MLLFAAYWFIPFQNTYFIPSNANTNFSLNNSSTEEMQFYSNLRFLSPNISYNLGECTLSKKGEMETAFEIIKNKTILNFYPVESNQEISITCQSTNKFEGDLFIAGEGGPMNITSSGNYNIIHNGAILLIRDSGCETPNVAIHELLHVLGFRHSSNQYNIMYNFSNCGQKIGEDTINKINEIYSIPPYPDLVFENVSVVMHGRYLNSNFTIKNIGLGSSEEMELNFYADNQKVESMDIAELEPGTGMKITLQNSFINQIDVKEIRMEIDYPLSELEKNNNKIILKVKN
jgi:hypothetical protein